MGSEIVESSLDGLHAEGSSTELASDAVKAVKDSESESGVTAVDRSPAAGGTGTASVDELGVALRQVSPDPYLDEFQPAQPQTGAGSPASETEPRKAARADAAGFGAGVGDAALAGLDLDVPPSAERPVAYPPASGASSTVAALNVDSTDQAVAREAARGEASPPASSPPGTSEHFAAIDLYAPPPSKAETGASRAPREAGQAKDKDQDEEEGPLDVNGVSWLVVMLASYASAVTLGLIWVLWGHRVAHEGPSTEPETSSAAESAADPGQRADRSRKYVPPAPLPSNRVIALGETIELDSLEVTPLRVTSGPVILRHAFNEREVRRGGENALRLTLRLKNRSSDSILVPLDEAFIRPRDRGIRDSFIEAGPTQQIAMFPLALESEWSIAGQEFPELNPEESFEAVVVSAAGALSRLGPEMIWRLRLRTDINKTETLGIRFREQEIQRTSPLAPPGRRDQPEPPTSDDSPRRPPSKR